MTLTKQDLSQIRDSVIEVMELFSAPIHEKLDEHSAKLDEHDPQKFKSFRATKQQNDQRYGRLVVLVSQDGLDSQIFSLTRKFREPVSPSLPSG